MRTKQGKLLSMVLTLVVILSLGLPAYAHEVPDPDRLGSITIIMRKGGTIIPGGTLTLYRVGEVVEQDGNYSFQPVGDFSACGESFETLDSAADLAARLKAFAMRSSIEGLSTKKVGSDGTVTFSDLELGLYLVVQHTAAPGYTALAPFLMSLPHMEDGTCLYDLSANPKTDLVPVEPPPPPPDEPPPIDPPPSPPDDPPLPDEPTPPTNPTPSLPQTGQLWWPVPLLACTGLLLIGVGVVLNRRREANEG